MIPEARGTIEVIYSDPHILVIDKPPGMLTHVHAADRHSPNVRAVLEHRLKHPVYTVHRLDRMTSGVMVLALTREAARELSLQFRNRSVSKRYLAIVRGHAPESGTITTPLATDTGETAEARTDFVTLARGSVPERVGAFDEAWFSVVELTLHTGRRHQARRHLHHVNHPVLGDNRHGDKHYNRWAAARFGVRSLYLRALRLEFTHPASGAGMCVQAGIPDSWMGVMRSLGLDENAVPGTTRQCTTNAAMDPQTGFV